MKQHNEWLFGSKQFQKEIKQLVEPINLSLGTNHFGYVSLNKSGELINLHTNIAWLENCIDKAYYLHDPCMVHPNNIHPGYAFYFTYDDQNFCNNMLKESIDEYDMAHEMIFVKHQNDKYEVFSLAAPKNHSKLYNMILNHPERIHQYFAHLVEGISSIKQKLIDRGINFAEIKGEKYHSQKGLISKPITRPN